MVSVIIPTYKRSDKIDAAIKSVVNQTFKNIEIIVIDDNKENSIDRIKTEEIVKKYKNIKYIKNKKNEGGCTSRNNGIKNSTGNYICFLDDDDEYTLDKIEKQLNFMIKNNLDVSFTDSKEINKEKQKIKTHKNFNKYNSILKYHLIEMIVTTGTFMFKKEVLDKIYFIKVPAGQEYYLMYRVILSNYKIGYLNEITLITNIHDDERITTNSKKIQAEKFLLQLKLKQKDILSYKDIRKIKYRYKYNVMKYYLNNKKYFKIFFYLVYLSLTSPIILLERLVD